MNINNINRRNTREWSMVNENSRGEAFRNAVVGKHGGSFTYLGKRAGWKWNDTSIFENLIEFKY
jgi:hypothetical protein